MNADTLIRWIKRQGFQVIKTSTTNWVELLPRIYQAIPYHWLICPNDLEINEIFRSRAAIAIRYSTYANSPKGMISYHVVYPNKFYTLDKLSGKARYDVRKGMKYFRVAPIPPEQLAYEGWEMRKETLVRQGRNNAENKKWWEKLCLTAVELSGVECWGATDIQTGKLASSLLAIACDNCFNILYQQSRTKYLPNAANNVLTYIVTSEALRRPGINEVFYGLHSLDAPASVDDYKFRMGYVAKPVRQRVVFNPYLTPCINDTTHRIVRYGRRFLPDNPFLAKTEGMIRFSLEGRKPLEEQHWPNILIKCKSNIFIEGE